MRWDDLFRDLEAQWSEAERQEAEAEIADRTRRELAGVAMLDRLRAAGSAVLDLQVQGAGRVAGAVRDVGPDWLLLDERTWRRDGAGAAGSGLGEVLLPLSAVLWVTGLAGRGAAPPAQNALAARIGLPMALRGLARDRVPVIVTTIDGSTATGTLDRVGKDCVDLAVHGRDELRRGAAVRGVRVFPLLALAAVRST